MLLVVCAEASAQLAYWDISPLYDTQTSPFYDDEAYTPTGRYGWNEERYARKVQQVASVIDSLSLPLIALYGVENEAVVRAITTRCKGDYSYLHTTLNTLDGLEFALLYYGDLFFPEQMEPRQRALHIKGLYRGEQVSILLIADPRVGASLVEEVREREADHRLIVAGRCEGIDAERFALHDAHAQAAKAGRGTTLRSSGWQMRERILIDSTYRLRRGDVFMRRWLLESRRGAPLATYEKGLYRGGVSKHLPVFAYFE